MDDIDEGYLDGRELAFLMIMMITMLLLCTGHFLYVAGALDNPKAIELSSPWYQESGPYCKLSVALHMNNMEDGNLKIVVETRNHTWVIVETLGNGLRE